MGTCVPYPISMLDFIRLKPLQVLGTPPLSLWVTRSFVLLCWEDAVCLELPSPLALTIVPSSLPHYFLNLKGRALMRTFHLGLCALKSPTFCQFSSCGSLCKFPFTDSHSLMWAEGGTGYSSIRSHLIVIFL